MKSLEKISALADKFEAKLKSQGQAAQVSQVGTTELFFGNESKQREFAAAIQDSNPASNPIMKILNATFAKTQAPCSFDLKITATAGQGASFNLNTVPAAIKAPVLNAINQIFTKVMGIPMINAQNAAAKRAKGGAGSGTIAIGSINLD